MLFVSYFFQLPSQRHGRCAAIGHSNRFFIFIPKSEIIGKRCRQFRWYLTPPALELISKDFYNRFPINNQTFWAGWSEYIDFNWYFHSLSCSILNSEWRESCLTNNECPFNTCCRLRIIPQKYILWLTTWRQNEQTSRNIFWSIDRKSNGYGLFLTFFILHINWNF